LQYVFGRDMCVDENGARPTNVWAVRIHRKASAPRWAATSRQKVLPFYRGTFPRWNKNACLRDRRQALRDERRPGQGAPVRQKSV